MEEVIAGPAISRLDIYDCSKLKAGGSASQQVDAQFAVLWRPAIETFDIRREHTGTFKDKEKRTS